MQPCGRPRGVPPAISVRGRPRLPSLPRQPRAGRRTPCGACQLRRGAPGSGSASSASPAAASRRCCGSSPDSTSRRAGRWSGRGHGHRLRLPERRLRLPARPSLQLVFQDPMGSLDPRMRVRNIIAEPLVAQGHPGLRKARVAELLEAVGLGRRGRRSLSPPVLRRSAPAHLDRACPRTVAVHPARRRAGQRPRRLGARAGAQPHRRPRRRSRAHPRLRLARPVRRASRVRAGRGHVRR